MLCVIALPPGTMLFPIALRQSEVVLYRRCRRRSVHRYELRVNVAFDSRRPSMAASLRALRVHICSRWIWWQRHFWEHTIRDEGTMCAIWNACTSTRPNMAMCRWLGTNPFDMSSVGGGRCLSTIGCLPSVIRDHNLVPCHSAEHPCGASALRGLELVAGLLQGAIRPAREALSWCNSDTAIAVGAGLVHEHQLSVLGVDAGG
jgi:hypothetical protein